MGQGRVRPVFTALPLPGIVVVGRRRHRYALPPPPRLGAPWPQIRSIQPLPRAPEKRLARLACSVGATRTAVLRGRRYTRNGGGGPTTVMPAIGGGCYLEWMLCHVSRSLPPFFGWRAERSRIDPRSPTRAAGWPGREGSFKADQHGVLANVGERGRGFRWYCTFAGSIDRFSG